MTGAPSTNGLAERMVQSFKNAVKADRTMWYPVLRNAQSALHFTTGKPAHSKAIFTSLGSMQHKLDSFLFNYRTAPNATTGHSPVQLLFGRNQKSRLDLLKPNVKRVVDSRLLQNGTKRLTSYQAGEEVWLRNYAGGSVTGKSTGENGPSLVPGASMRYCVETSCGQNEAGNAGPR